MRDKVFMKHDELLPTRASLIRRLKNWQDDASWQDFFRVYWKLIYGIARKAGLADDEAQDVVQETLIAVAKHMPTFNYDPTIGSFKAWLLNITRWRIIDRFRKRQPAAARAARETTSGTATIDGVPDPNAPDLDAIWEAEWETNLLQVAKENLKRRIDPQHSQIFDFYVDKEWPPEKVAERFSISVDMVYQTKHRVIQLLRAEVARLEKEMT
jgi:RNA polymerase sigma factor (sigma-70 family)